MLSLVDGLVREGQNLRNFCGQICRHVRNLLVARTAGGTPQLLEASRAERERLAKQAALFTEEDLTRYLQIVLRLYQDLHHSTQPRFHVELGLLKLVHARRLTSIEEVIAGLGSPSGGSAPRGPSSGPSGAPPKPTPFERDQQRRSTAAPPPPVATNELAGRLIAALEEKGRTMTAVILERAVNCEVVDDTVIASFPAQGNAHLPKPDDQKLLAQLATEILGRAVTFRAVLVDQASAAAASPAPAAAPPASGGIMNHPEVGEFLRQFPGAVVEEPKRR
jgi:DNA polymerase-3 subunit gamma/tau